MSANIMLKSVPNTMTVLRLAAAPFVAALIWADDPEVGYPVALVLFILASVSDFFDGWMARRLRIVSKFGTMLDPIADKVLIGVCLLALAKVTSDGWLFFVPALVIMFREFFVSGLREFMAGRSVSIPVSQLAKWKTTLQLVAIGVIDRGTGVPQDGVRQHSRPCGAVGIGADHRADRHCLFPRHARPCLIKPATRRSTPQRPATAMSWGLPDGREAARQPWRKS